MCTPRDVLTYYIIHVYQCCKRNIDSRWHIFINIDSVDAVICFTIRLIWVYITHLVSLPALSEVPHVYLCMLLTVVAQMSGRDTRPPLLLERHDFPSLCRAFGEWTDTTEVKLTRFETGKKIEPVRIQQPLVTVPLSLVYNAGAMDDAYGLNCWV